MPEANARANLRRELSSLRRTVGEHLAITRQEVAFNRDAPYWLDVEVFEAATGQGAIARLREAMQLYRGDFLEGFYVREAPAFEEWVLVQQTRLRELPLQALHKLSVRYAQQGEPGLEEGIKYTSRLLALEPSREEAHRQLMLLLAQSGQRGAALAQYDACRQDLAATLDAQTLTNEQIQTIEEFAREVEEAFELIDDDDFDAKRAMIDRLGIEVRLAVENGERVAYVSSPVLGNEVLPIMGKPSRKVAPTPTIRLHRPAGA